MFKDKNGKTTITGGIAIATFCLLCLLLFLWGCPAYNVYRSRKNGEAELAQAQYSREVAVAEAKAKKESAVYLADAEIIRARGVDSAVTIIGGALNTNQSYLRYLYIQELKETNNQIIYLPTEAGLPILEANRLNKIANTPDQ